MRLTLLVAGVSGVLVVASCVGGHQELDPDAMGPESSGRYDSPVTDASREVAPDAPSPELPPTELPPAELPVADLPQAELPPGELPPAELPRADLPDPTDPGIEAGPDLPVVDPGPDPTDGSGSSDAPYVFPDASDCPGGVFCGCEFPTDCYTGLCVESSQGKVCSRLCGQGVECPSGWTCQAMSTGGETVNGCAETAVPPPGDVVETDEDPGPVDAPYVFPEASDCPGGTFCPCEFPSDCYTGLCVATLEGGLVCSRLCGQGVECPYGWSCQRMSAGGEEVYGCVEGPVTPAPDVVDAADAPDAADASCEPPVLTSCPETTCSPVVDLADADAVLAYLKAAIWNLATPTCAVMGEVRVSGGVVIDSSSFEAPAWCTEGACKTYFQMTPAVPGITCLAPANAKTMCTKVEIAAAMPFRVRAARSLIDGFAPRTIALFDLLGPCQTPCGIAEFSCPDHTCWASLYQHCGGCLGGSADVCACRDADGVVEDGTECFWSSGDILGRGFCRCGTCIH